MNVGETAIVAMHAMKVDYGCEYWLPGIIVDHPDGYEVYIIRGQYRDSTYGRVSNHWTWAKLDPDIRGFGYVLGKQENGYGWNP